MYASTSVLIHLSINDLNVNNLILAEWDFHKGKNNIKKNRNIETIRIYYFVQ